MNSDELRDLIRSELNQFDEPDLWDVTRKVVAALDPADHIDVLEITMRPYVSDVVKNSRQATVTAAVALPDPAPMPMAPRIKTPGPSRRVVGAAAWRQRLNDTLITVVPGQNPKRLGKCTVADLTNIRNDYMTRAKDMAQQAQWYDRIIKAMLAVKAATLADLPDATLQPLLAKVHAA